MKSTGIFFSSVLLLFSCLLEVTSFAPTTPTTTTTTNVATPRSSVGFDGTSELQRRRRSDRTMLSAERNNDNSNRRPWNVFQFVQQSSRFVNVLPSLPSSSKEQQTIVPGQVLWKAGGVEGRNNVFTFAPLDDVVMGGASSSNFDDATGKWKGDVTDANNGGFIGIRSTPVIEYDMSNCQGIKLTMFNPDGGNYDVGLRLKVVLRDSTDFNGIGWTSSVDIPPSKKGSGRGIFNLSPTSSSPSSPAPTVVFVPFKKQIPTRFAKTVSDATNFASDQVNGIQFVFSKFEYDGELNPKFELGDFEVQLSKIEAY